MFIIGKINDQPHNEILTTRQIERYTETEKKKSGSWLFKVYTEQIIEDFILTNTLR